MSNLFFWSFSQWWQMGKIIIDLEKVSATLVIEGKKSSISVLVISFIPIELPFPSFTFFTFLLFLFIVLNIVKRPKGRNSTPKLPPGPKKLPLIGNMHQLVGSLPHHSLTSLAKKHGPLMHIQLGEVSTTVVSTPEMATEVMKTHDINFVEKPKLLASKIMSYNFTSIAFAPYGDYWQKLRKICTMELLSAKRVKSFRSIREEEVSSLIRTTSANEGMPINLSKKIFSLTYGITSRAAFGKKCKDQEEFISVITEIVKLAAGFCLADLYPSIKVLQLISGMRPKLEKLHQKIDRILENIINEHRESKTTRRNGDGEAEDGLVDILLKLQEHGDPEFSVSDNKIKAVISNMFSAGSETSSTTLEWTMAEMIKNPSVMKRAQDEVRQVFVGKGDVDETSIHELKFLKSVIKETMRLHPPVPLIPRECRVACEINGYDIPVKTRVLVNSWAIGRDPSYWNEAERFFPKRFLDIPVNYKGTDFEYIPFGAGRRMCPGISFALPNIELPLAQLLYHFDWKLPNGMKHEDLDMTEGFGVTIRRKEDLHLIPIPHHHFPVE